MTQQTAKPSLLDDDFRRDMADHANRVIEAVAGSPCLNEPVRTKEQVAEALGRGLAPVDLIRDMTALHKRLADYLHLRRDVHDHDEWFRMAEFADKLSDAIESLRVADNSPAPRFPWSADA